MVEIKKLSLGVMQSNCYIVYDNTSKECVIIDPGDESQKIIDSVNELGLKVSYIILTHAHFDHIAAVDNICCKFNSGIIMHKNDEILLSNPNYNLSSRFPIDNVMVKSGNIKYVNDDILVLIDHEFRFIHTPGHSPGSMCIKVGNYIFTGDTLFRLSVGNEFPPFGDFKLEIDSIKNKLYSLDGNFECFPGHGDKTTLNYERKYNQYTL